VAAVDHEAAILDHALSRHENYTSHVAEVLDNLQRVIAGDLGAAISDYIERGILEPAREYLMTDPSEHVRLAILTPREEDSARWQMVLAAGHSLAGREKYHEPIVSTMSRYAFETGQPQSWDDVTAERAFAPTPLASRPFRSMISLPILAGDEILGVFNVISADAFAFDPAEERYIASLGGVINVAVGLWLKEQAQEPDDSD
jgi:GAF domain-containing protein